MHILLIYLSLLALGFYFGKFFGAIGLCIIYFFIIHSRKIKQQKHKNTDNSNHDDNNWAYRELGVSKSSDINTVKSARKKLLNHYHPDKLGIASEVEKKAAEEKVNKINQAYIVIKKQKGFDE